MKTIGLVGGTGWVSTVEYYRIINEEVNRRLGGMQFAKCILYSVNYGDIAEWNKKKDIDSIQHLIMDAAMKLTTAGAECIVLCANTLHRFAENVEEIIEVPLIHIAEATGKEINKQGFSKVGLLGTKQTMELDFYKKKFQEKNIDVIVPEQSERDFIQNTIDQELLKSVFKDDSRNRFKEIITDLNNKGAQAIILGCTEIPLLIKQTDIDVPLIDTLDIHAKAAVDFSVR
jgi:aspartate racemase